MNLLAIIPARGGSKGVPRKNVRLIAGKPLIAWMIEAARGTRHPMRVIVSTEDEEIARIAQQYGAEVPFMRPPELAQDLSTDIEFLTHALVTLKADEGYEPDIVLRLPPTAPLTRSEHIDKGIDTLLTDSSLDSVRPIVEAPKHPYKFWKIAEDGAYLEPFLSKTFTGFDEPHNLPRQLFPPVYAHTGAMEVMRTRTILGERSSAGKKVGFFFMEPEESINIDHPLDFDLAELLLGRRSKA